MVYIKDKINTKLEKENDSSNTSKKQHKKVKRKILYGGKLRNAELKGERRGKRYPRESRGVLGHLINTSLAKFMMACES